LKFGFCDLVFVCKLRFVIWYLFEIWGLLFGSACLARRLSSLTGRGVMGIVCSSSVKVGWDFY